MIAVARSSKISPAWVAVHVIQRRNNRQACFVSNEDHWAYTGWSNFALGNDRFTRETIKMLGKCVTPGKPGSPRKAASQIENVVCPRFPPSGYNYCRKRAAPKKLKASPASFSIRKSQAPDRSAFLCLLITRATIMSQPRTIAAIHSPYKERRYNGVAGETIAVNRER